MSESKKFFFFIKSKVPLSSDQVKAIHDALGKVITGERDGFIVSDSLDIDVVKSRLTDVMKKQKSNEYFIGLAKDIESIRVKEIKIKFK